MTDQPAPVVCTLSPKELQNRHLEWGDIRTLSLTTSAVENGVLVTFPIKLAHSVEDLAERENHCCGSWLSTTTERLEDTIRLEITTQNPEGLPLILSMAGLA